MLYFVFEIIGTIAFALSGIRVAADRGYDWFGGFVLAWCVAVGGGTLRDCMLGYTPFWMTSPVYICCTAVAMLIFIAFKHGVTLMARAWMLFDTIGLAVFTIAGAQKTIDAGMPVWVAIMMGCITGAAGGVIRDVLASRKPVIFHSDIYAMATVLGGAVYFLLLYVGVNDGIASIAGMAAVVVMRILAVRYKWHLPYL